MTPPGAPAILLLVLRSTANFPFLPPLFFNSLLITACIHLTVNKFRASMYYEIGAPHPPPTTSRHLPAFPIQSNSALRLLHFC